MALIFTARLFKEHHKKGLTYLFTIIQLEILVLFKVYVNIFN